MDSDIMYAKLLGILFPAPENPAMLCVHKCGPEYHRLADLGKLEVG